MILPQGAGGLTATNMPLRLLVRMTYGVQDFQIVGGPSWQMSSKFDITAKAAEGTTKSTEDLMPLVKTLLADRFKLKTHMETRELPTYELVVARSDGTLGPDIKPSTSDCSGAAEAQKKLAEAILKGGPAAHRVVDAQAGRDGEVRDRACDQSSQSCGGLWPPRRRTADDDAHAVADAVRPGGR